MFKPLVIFRHKLLWSDDTWVRKITGAVPETTDPADFKLFFALFCNYLIIDDLCLQLVKTVIEPCLYLPSVLEILCFQSPFHISWGFHREFPKKPSHRICNHSNRARTWLSAITRLTANGCFFINFFAFGERKDHHVSSFPRILINFEFHVGS